MPNWKQELHDKLAAKIEAMPHLQPWQKKLLLAEELKAAVKATETGVGFGQPITEEAQRAAQVPFPGEYMASAQRLAELRRRAGNIVPSSKQIGTGKSPVRRAIIPMERRITTWILEKLPLLRRVWPARKRSLRN